MAKICICRSSIPSLCICNKITLPFEDLEWHIDGMEDPQLIRIRFETISPFLDERTRRLIAAAEAEVLGRGGITRVSQETGLCREAIRLGKAELHQEPPLTGSRIRKKGGGRKRTEEKAPTLKIDLERLINPVTRGDPESPLRWTCKSTRQLAEALKNQGHQTSHRMVAEMLGELRYSLQGNRKTLEGEAHADRNQQFEYLHQQVTRFQDKGHPVISVDTKKKELVGRFKNNGQEWQPQGEPEPVETYDFPSAAQGKVAPYGVYDPTRNEGWRMWVRITIQRLLPWKVFDVGGRRWAAKPTPTPDNS